MMAASQDDDDVMFLVFSSASIDLWLFCEGDVQLLLD
jgi:hypothetical protein